MHQIGSVWYQACSMFIVHVCMYRLVLTQGYPNSHPTNSTYILHVHITPVAKDACFVYWQYMYFTLSCPVPIN